MKGKGTKYLVLLILLFNCFIFLGQNTAKPPGKKNPEGSRREIRRKERKERRERWRKEGEERAAVKAYHKRLQTKKVRKRMKRSKHKATLHNENRREPFMKRLFMKKKKV